MNKLRTHLQNRPIGTIGKYSFFSVLVPIVKKDGKLHLLYEVRSPHMKRQPGEICFPGGQMKLGESASQAALRETVEELGVEESKIQLMGQMDTLYTYSNFTVYSFLGNIEKEAVNQGQVNPEEVEETFLVPIDYLKENPPKIHDISIEPVIGDDFPYDKIDFPQGYQWRKGVSKVPIYQFEGRVIWGLTARITNSFINILKEADHEI
ncbi:MAG: CoA pyrophosphatase [Anaerovoracaceae bacterium]